MDSLSADKITKEEILANGEKEVRSILKDIDNNQKEIGTKLYESYQLSNIVGDCSCGGKLVKKYSRRNKQTFIGCSKFPKCRNTYSLPKKANILKSTCPTCGLPMISIPKKGQKGREHVCLDPNCGKDVSKRQAPEVVGECPECGKDLLSSSSSSFSTCSSFVLFFIFLFFIVFLFSYFLNFFHHILIFYKNIRKLYMYIKCIFNYY